MKKTRFFRKNWKVTLLSSILLTIIVSSGYLYVPLSNINGYFIDKLFQYRGVLPTQNKIIIVDIDEDSLNDETGIGHWPWSRDKISTLVSNIKKHGASVIGLDILFPEKDNTSPKIVLDELDQLVGLSISDQKQIKSAVNDIYSVVEDTNKLDYDKDFSSHIQDQNIVLSYGLIFEQDNIKSIVKDIESCQGCSIDANDSFDYLLKPYRILYNTEELFNNTMSQGFAYAMPEASGLIRKAPLVIKFFDEDNEETIYTSLALEMIHLYHNLNNIVFQTDKYGLEKIYLSNDKKSLNIPVDRNGNLYINFRGPAKTFPYISAVDIINDNIKEIEKFDLKDKLVLVGSSALGLNDVQANSFDSVFPGVEVHANILDNFLAEDFLSRPSFLYSLELIILCMIIFTLALILSIESINIFASVAVVLAYLSSFVYLVYHFIIELHILVHIVWFLIAIVLTFIVIEVINYIHEYNQKEQIKGVFANKVSDDVMNELINDDIKNKDKTLNITIFFSDIRSFSTITEQLNDIKKLKEIMVLYFNKVSKSIIDTHGTIDKFIGDAVMAYWGAPLNDPNEKYAKKAIASAVKQIKLLSDEKNELQVLLKKYLEEVSGQKNDEIIKKIFPLNIGIGIHTGEAIVGELGSDTRSDYTILGDNVNIASRIESLCKTYDARILMSHNSVIEIFDDTNNTNEKANIIYFEKDKSTNEIIQHNKEINKTITIDNEHYVFIDTIEDIDNLKENDIAVRHVDNIMVAGKDISVGFYEVLIQYDLKELKIFNDCFKTYLNGDFISAQGKFEKLEIYKESLKPEPKREDQFIDRCEKLDQVKHKLGNVDTRKGDQKIMENYEKYKAWSYDKK